MTVSSAGSVEVPGTELVQLAEEEIGVEGESIAPGQFVELTFSFQNAESVTVEVPVVARRGDYAEIPVPSEEPSRRRGDPSGEPTTEEPTAGDPHRGADPGRVAAAPAEPPRRPGPIRPGRRRVPGRVGGFARHDIRTTPTYRKYPTCSWSTPFVRLWVRARVLRLPGTGPGARRENHV